MENRKDKGSTWIGNWNIAEARSADNGEQWRTERIKDLLGLEIGT